MTHLIRQMGHVAFSVPDPDISAQDLVEITGLKMTGTQDGTVYLSSNRRHHEVSYRKGPEGGGRGDRLGSDGRGRGRGGRAKA